MPVTPAAHALESTALRHLRLCADADRLWSILRGVLGGVSDSDARTVRRYEAAYEAFFSGSRALAFWKGRVALHALLRAADLRPGDEVILPGYTCSMVPAAILFAGARPVYVDIRAHDYNMDPAAVEAAITPRTRAMVVQHTYGFPADMDALLSLARRHGLVLIEDCCHALGCTWRGQWLGSFGDAAFFSSQWNKHYTTGLGGMAVIRRADLADRVARLRDCEAYAPGPSRAWLLAVLMLVHHLTVFPTTITAVQRLFRWLAAHGLLIGSASPSEFTATCPPRYFTRMSAVQARVGLVELARLERNLRHRRQLVTFYDDMLDRTPPGVVVQPLVRYPVRVTDRQRVLREAARRFVEIGTWFECPLHPAETDHDAFGYRPGSCPVAEEAARQVVNLPVHPRTTRAAARRAAQLVRPWLVA